MLIGEMICTECGREVKRVCRDCQAARTRQGMLQHQRRFLQTWLVGAIDLRVRIYGGVAHLELFDDRWHSYCGTAMFDITERLRTRELPADLCPECRKIFDELLARYSNAI